MRGLFARILLLLGAVIVFSGVIDLAVGPELAEQDTGVGPGEGGSHWSGLIILAVGVAVIALGAWIGGKFARPSPGKGA